MAVPSNYIDKFEDHPVHDQLLALEGEIGELERQVESDSWSEDQALYAKESAARFRQVANRADQRLDSVDPLLADQQTLKNLNTHIKNCVSSIRAFIKNKDNKYLSTAHERADTVVRLLSYLPVPANLDEVESVGETVRSIRQSAGQHERYLKDDYKKLQDKFQELEQNVKSLSASVDNEQQRIDKTLSNFQEQFSNSAETRRKEFNEEIKELQSEITETTDEWKDELRDLRKEIDAELSNLKDEGSKTIKEIEETLVADGRKKIEKIESYKDEAAELVSIISASGMTSRYQEIADNERSRVFWFQLLAIGSMLGLIVMSVWLFFQATSVDLSWPQIAAKSLAVGAFGALAAYAGKQATQHRKLQRINREMELRLRSIGPYLADLPEEEATEVRTELGREFFRLRHDGEPKEKQKEIPSRLTPANFPKEVAKNIIDLAREK